MKRMFVLSVLIFLAMICSCQKQDSAAEGQLAQRKAELDAREKALDEREKALAEREKAIASTRTIFQSRSQVADPAQVKAERDRRIQQLPPEVKALIAAPPDTSREKAEKDRILQERVVQTPRSLEDSVRTKMSRAAATPEAMSPEAEATSPSPSPTPE